MRNQRMDLRIACIGRHGQTAQALAALAARVTSFTLVQGDRRVADLADAQKLAAFLDDAQADAVINAGAYNLVDRAESEPDAAFAINAEGPRHLARLCRERGLPFIHMSTDCVFDGVKTGGYTEDDAPNPLSVYGRSKLAGELAVMEEDVSALVVRVCWVFSEYADSFVAKMIQFARTQPKLRVVSDQIGPPTYAPDIAAALIAATRLRMEDPANLRGLLHVAAPETMTRAAMAEAIMAESARQGGRSVPVEPVPTTAFAAQAARPLNAVLSGERATARLGLVYTPFADALAQSVAGMLARA